MNLRREIARLRQYLGTGRRVNFVIVDIPGGKPDRVFFDDGTEEEWTGGTNYPPGALVLGGFDPDLTLGRDLHQEPSEGSTEGVSDGRATRLAVPEDNHP